jgi:hypothetical protein
MMPLELGRAVISQAGGATALEATCRALDTTAAALPHICVRDRDLLTDTDVAQLESDLPGLFVWPNRCLENELLDSQLLQRTLYAAGITTTVENITADLRRIADEQTEEVLAALVRQELMQAHGYEVPGSLSATDRLRAYIEQVHAASAAQLEEFDQTVERISAGFPDQWERDWYKLMDGKRVIRQYAGLTPFRNLQYLFGAICATVARERDILPPGVALLGRRLHHLMATTVEAHA